MAYTPISNGETGLSARTKINNIGTGLDSADGRISQLEEEISYFSACVFGDSPTISDSGSGIAVFWRG